MVKIYQFQYRASFWIHESKMAANNGFLTLIVVWLWMNITSFKHEIFWWFFFQTCLLNWPDLTVSPIYSLIVIPNCTNEIYNWKYDKFTPLGKNFHFWTKMENIFFNVFYKKFPKTCSSQFLRFQAINVSKIQETVI